MSHPVIHPTVKKVVWIRVGALGDLLVGTPNLADAHKIFPNADVIVMGDKIWTEILSPEQWPRIKGIVVIEKRGSLRGIYHAAQNNQWVATNETKPLRYFFKNLDAIVNTRYESLRYAWGPWAMGVKIRYGMCPPPFKWIYTHWAPSLGKDPQIYERDLASFIIRGASIVKKFSSLLEPNVKIARSLVEQMNREGLEIPRLKKTVLSQKNYLIINPTASIREKAWPSKNFRELALKLKNSHKTPAIKIVGTKKESEWLKEVAGSDFEIIQPNTIRDLIDVVEGAQLLITNASSMQFIAASTKTRVLTLIGNANPKIWGPLGPDDIYLKPDPIVASEKNIFKLEEMYFEKLSVDKVFETCLSMAQNFSHTTSD